ncbi:hypothetical protein ACFL29_01590 [Patescibacteria group bacterium]
MIAVEMIFYNSLTLTYIILDRKEVLQQTNNKRKRKNVDGYLDSAGDCVGGSSGVLDLGSL